MEIKILGVGCKKCETMEHNVEEALRILTLTVPIVKITDIKEIASYGVIGTPALIFDNHLISAGRNLSVQDIVIKLTQYLMTQVVNPGAYHNQNDSFN